jgi:tRNA (cmo5U34)-methyltransferase
MKNPKNVGESIEARNAGWRFSGAVPQSFDDHVAKSVPLYELGHDLIVSLCDFFLSDGSVCYDIGCSTGGLIKKIAAHNADKHIEAIGIDAEADMVRHARSACTDASVSFLHDDVLNVDLKKCDLIVSYYTMQFVRPKSRQVVIDRIYQALNWGGAFVMFEKVRACDARFQDIMSALYVDYKLEQGYDSAQIVAKSRSLKGVLEPFSTQGNTDLLRRAGFVDLMTVMKYVCFEGYLAIK